LRRARAHYSDSLPGHGKKLFHLLKVKCDMVARDLEMPVGSLVLKGNVERTGTETSVVEEAALRGIGR
jgi:hypothetical protein